MKKDFKKYINFPVLFFCSAICYVIYISYTEKQEEVAGIAKERIVVNYWEKWSGSEYDAMKSIVDDFNKSQTTIYVKMLSVSTIDQKLMLATAGGNPPDVAGLWTHSLNTFSSKGALMPLDKFIKRSGIRKEDYIPVYWDMCQAYGFTWGLPSTPASLALHWNRKLFEEAGLDPDTPPKNIDELNRFAERLTIVEVMRKGEPVRVRFHELTETEKNEKKFLLLQLGYTPSVPGWFNEMWGFWFGADLWDGKSKITSDSKDNIAALKWFSSFPKKYGIKNLQYFSSSFGIFASPQDPFLSGKVAMVLQGVWLNNFIKKYNPHLDWKAAAFPSVDPVKYPNVTIAESDVLVIPKGAKHPNAAFEFIKYVNMQKNIEKLNTAQGKFSPLAKISKEFITNHPNPYIQVFIDLAKSANARHVPDMPVWNEYKNEMIVAYDQAFTGVLTPVEALKNVDTHAQWKLDRALRRWDAVSEKRIKSWEKER